MYGNVFKVTSIKYSEEGIITYSYITSIILNNQLKKPFGRNRMSTKQFNASPKCFEIHGSNKNELWNVDIFDGSTI